MYEGPGVRRIGYEGPDVRTVLGMRVLVLMEIWEQGSWCWENWV